MDCGVGVNEFVVVGVNEFVVVGVNEFVVVGVNEFVGSLVVCSIWAISRRCSM